MLLVDGGDGGRIPVAGRDQPHHPLGDLRLELAHDDVTVHVAGSIAEAREQLALRQHRLAILDLMLPDGDGSELLAELAATQPPTMAIIYSALDSPAHDSAIVLQRLVKSRHGGRELAALIADYLKHWPARPVPSDGGPP